MRATRAPLLWFAAHWVMGKQAMQRSAGSRDVRHVLLGVLLLLGSGCAQLPRQPVPDAPPVPARAVVFDIDGTLTPDVSAVFSVRKDAASAVSAYAGKGYQVIYLSARVAWLSAGIPDWLKKHGFPDGTLQVAPTRADRQHPDVYKTGVLKEFISRGWRLDYAYGDSSTDLLAYAAAGIPKEHVFALRREGDAACQPGVAAECLAGWTGHLAFIAGSVASARDAAAPDLLLFNSDAGLARLDLATAKADFAALANQFEAQTHIAFCGPTTAAIVLNALRSGSAGLPRDHSRLRAGDLRHTPAGVDPVVARFTPDEVIARGAKTRAQVLGEPVTIDGKTIQDYGYQVRQFDELLRAHGLPTRLVIVDEKMADDAIRKDLVDNLARRGDFVVVNYQRKAIGQQGGGHISPLGAYDAASDSFLVLDVNPANAGWVWIPAATLIKGMRTFDTVENRGYVLIRRQ